MNATCGVKGCDRPVRCRGMCAAHYGRFMAGGDISAPLRVVFRGKSDKDRLISKTVVNPETGCWEWQASKTPLGYGQMRFQGTRRLSHRVAWILFRGPIPTDENAYETMGVLHSCDNPACVNPEHLFLGNQQANALDAVSKNRWGKRGMTGESHGRAVVTEEQVRAIRASSASPAELAIQFGLSKGAIQHILKRRSWKHI